MRPFSTWVFLLVLAASLTACSSMSSTRQLSPDREPAVPHGLLLSDSVSPPPDSLRYH
ncbi:hypothetical protein J0X19_21770 [Hymenobacter sp. BT186]|uniref:Uncharacterized protein n=1 Tax=Hymenobacter telluris TaxID=2816474 RepID=A0A939F1Y5_9BACT|nr:hypothetical protein [Hymenobacter telluris]MBO0360605.1 hypothetical protein [Hymenobacter telluris]MBW3376632.1 hypothetical protein [Hymenobacter norwichensis]